MGGRYLGHEVAEIGLADADVAEDQWSTSLKITPSRRSLSGGMETPSWYMFVAFGDQLPGSLPPMSVQWAFVTAKETGLSFQNRAQQVDVVLVGAVSAVRVVGDVDVPGVDVCEL